MTTTSPKNIEKGADTTSDEVQKISNFRRVLSQTLAASAKNLIIVNVGNFASFSSIVIPSLIGLNAELNPDETIRLTAAETSWLASFAHIAHPIGSLLSGPISDRFGRRKTIMMVTVPLIVAWLMLGFAKSVSILYFGFIVIGFCMGLKESPTITYVSEISEPSQRGTMTAYTAVCWNIGSFMIMGFGAILSWRQVSVISAFVPMICFIAVLFIPESPFWLLSKDRSKEAQESLQWLRGWASPRTILTEFTELQDFSRISNACLDCSKDSKKCYHPKPKFWQNLGELKRKRNIKPFILCFGIAFLYQFNLCMVWQPYIIQVLIALGTPINASLVTVLNTVVGGVASIVLMSTVKTFGRRMLYFTMLTIAAICAFGLSIYGFILLPSGWISFKRTLDEAPKDPEYIRSLVGNYGYLAISLLFLSNFAVRLGIGTMTHMYMSEVFPFKSRSFMCGITTAVMYLLATISSKLYYTLEMALSLPGATAVYGFISFFGLIVMYFIMPETEQRSLEDIELHYSDNRKGITDIHIARKSEQVE